MLTERPTLPASCEACSHFVADQNKAGICRRHAPPPGQDEFEVAYWPNVLRSDRCGAGVAGESFAGSTSATCQVCTHWLQPGNVGVLPDFRRGLSKAWWNESGICTRFAPSPSVEEGQQTRWRITHKSDHCGDGERATGQTDD